MLDELSSNELSSDELSSEELSSEELSSEELSAIDELLSTELSEEESLDVFFKGNEQAESPNVLSARQANTANRVFFIEYLFA